MIKIISTKINDHKIEAQGYWLSGTKTLQKQLKIVTKVPYVLNMQLYPRKTWCVQNLINTNTNGCKYYITTTLILQLALSALYIKYDTYAMIVQSQICAQIRNERQPVN